MCGDLFLRWRGYFDFKDVPVIDIDRIAGHLEWLD